MSTTPPGWYDDGRGSLRWWDGETWTEHAQPYTPIADASGNTADIETPQAQQVPQVPPVPPLPGSPLPGSPVPPAGTPFASATQVAPPYATAPHASAAATAPYAGAQATAPYASAAPQAPAAPPRKSRGWVLPVVILGAVVVLLGAGTAVALILWNLFSGAGSAVAEPSGAASSEPGEASADPEAGAGAEVGLDHPAVAAVEQYDVAYQTSDCDLFFASSSDLFVEQAWDGVDCDGFLESTAEFNATVEDYEVTVTYAAQGDDGSIVVSTEESYTSTLEDDSGTAYVDEYEYTVIEEDGAWVVDGIADTAGTQ